MSGTAQPTQQPSVLTRFGPVVLLVVGLSLVVVAIQSAVRVRSITNDSARHGDEARQQNARFKSAVEKGEVTPVDQATFDALVQRRLAKSDELIDAEFASRDRTRQCGAAGGLCLLAGVGWWFLRRRRVATPLAPATPTPRSVAVGACLWTLGAGAVFIYQLEANPFQESMWPIYAAAWLAVAIGRTATVMLTLSRPTRTRLLLAALVLDIGSLGLLYARTAQPFGLFGDEDRIYPPDKWYPRIVGLHMVLVLIFLRFATSRPSPLRNEQG